ncbi:MAG: tRNA pseudouridine(55) synthase TruB [Clostridia bacterium]|nr:tRNA pseudouridine(55) synthase TruB [Clostridia bacterium]
MNGLFLLNKSPEMTSFLAGRLLRKELGVSKVGHTGTLDPNATGVLPVLCGNATRALDLLPVQDKRYTATFRFGFVSPTLDVWSEATATGKPLPTVEAIEAALPAFRGDILQVPPMMSAIQKDGVRLYELARQGIEIEREARSVTVYALNMLQYNEASGELTLDCACSKGTYIRTIGDDLGRMLGCGAVMTALCRTEAAGYSLADCLTLDDVRALSQEERLKRLLPTDSLFSVWPALTVSAAQAVRFSNGGALALDRLKFAVNSRVRVYAPDGRFLGIGHPAENELKVTKLFP